MDETEKESRRGQRECILRGIGEGVRLVLADSALLEEEEGEGEWTSGEVVEDGEGLDLGGEGPLRQTREPTL